MEIEERLSMILSHPFITSIFMTGVPSPTTDRSWQIE
jgi:hypothetical protein